MRTLLVVAWIMFGIWLVLAATIISLKRRQGRADRGGWIAVTLVIQAVLGLLATLTESLILTAAFLGGSVGELWYVFQITRTVLQRRRVG